MAEKTDQITNACVLTVMADGTMVAQNLSVDWIMSIQEGDTIRIPYAPGKVAVIERKKDQETAQ